MTQRRWKDKRGSKRKNRIQKNILKEGKVDLNLLTIELKKRKAYLENLQLNIKNQLENMPDGRLRISNDRGNLRYYYVTEGKDPSGKYITKENRNLASELAQKDYIKKLYVEVEEELQDIDQYLHKHSSTNLEDIYRNMNDHRKNLINPLVLPDELYVQQWNQESYPTNPYYLEQKIYPTKNGEMVRSKSEAILADMYFDLGIPYRYEAELQLNSHIKRYPDFTLLNIKNKEHIYHEHLGLIDNEEYRRNNLRKIDEYRRNGIYSGKNLIITYEADGSYLNIKEIRQIVLEMFELTHKNVKL